MTIAPFPQRRAARLQASGVDQMIELLERDFGRTDDPREATAVNQFLLDALDRGEYRSMTVWPAEDPLGVCYQGSGGLVVPAGVAMAAEPLAASVRSSGWRVLVGDLGIGRTIVDQSASGLFRRRPYSREQRLMIAEHPMDVRDRRVQLRRAGSDDIEVLTDFASRLHVEDQMGPPLSRGGRSSVQQRVASSVRRGSSWVALVDGRIVGKVDVAIESRRRGAQLAGVYVDRGARGRGVARDAVAALADRLLRSGMDCVTLHVRADNAPAIRAYQAAGFAQRRRWLLALR